MRSHQRLRLAGAILAGCMSVLLLTACSHSEPDLSGTFFGPSQSVGQGTVKTYTTLDRAGNPTEVGIRISATSLAGLPTEDSVPPRMLMLDFPDQAHATVFDHVMFNWNSHGHEPAILFGKPHFDIHFYMTDMASVAGIDPGSPDFATRAAHLPDPKYVPLDYVPVPGPPAQNAVPGMGLHWIDTTDGVEPGKYDFTQILINGSWDGRYTFIEPMMTREWMLTKPSIQKDIKQPHTYQESGYFPTIYSVRYDDQAQEYAISLSGMTMRHAS